MRLLLLDLRPRLHRTRTASAAARASLALTLLAVTAAWPAAQTPSPPKPVATDAFGLTWEVAYLIDTSQEIDGKTQFSSPRSTRGVGVSADGRFLYVGYNEPNTTVILDEHDHQVRKIDTTFTDLTDATVAVLPQHRGKSIAVDDVCVGAAGGRLPPRRTALTYNVHP